MISVGSMAAHSGLRAGSALSIGVGGNELSKAIALLRSVGGRMYLPGLTSRVASDGSGGSPVAGDVIGWLPDRVSGVNATTQSTTGFKPKLIREPILGPELVVNGSGDNTAGWIYPDATVASVGGEFVLTAVNTTYPAIYRAFPTVVGKKYLVSGDMRNGTATTAIAVYPIPHQGAVYTGAATSSMTRRTCEFVATGTSTQVAAAMRTTTAAIGSTAIFDNISVREILGYTERYSLEFDGVDDYIAAPSAATLSDGLVMVWAGARLSAATGRLLCLGEPTLVSAEMNISITDSSYVRAEVLQAGTFKKLSIAAGELGDVKVVAARLTSSSLSIRVNGGSWVNLSHGLTLTNAVLNVLSIGARAVGATPRGNARCSAGIAANLGASATDANIAILERAAAQAAGITL